MALLKHITRSPSPPTLIVVLTDAQRGNVHLPSKETIHLDAYADVAPLFDDVATFHNRPSSIWRALVRTLFFKKKNRYWVCGGLLEH